MLFFLIDWQHWYVDLVIFLTWIKPINLDATISIFFRAYSQWHHRWNISCVTALMFPSAFSWFYIEITIYQPNHSIMPFFYGLSFIFFLNSTETIQLCGNPRHLVKWNHVFHRELYRDSSHRNEGYVIIYSPACRSKPSDFFSSVKYRKWLFGEYPGHFFQYYKSEWEWWLSNSKMTIKIHKSSSYGLCATYSIL